MVSINASYLLSELNERLGVSLNESLNDLEPHIFAFIHKIFSSNKELTDVLHKEIKRISEQESIVVYGGYQNVAFLGFVISSEIPYPDNFSKLFIDGLIRLIGRSGSGIDLIKSDDIALLGIIIGLTKIDIESIQIQSQVLEAQNWLINIIATSNGHNWTSRLRDLAGDLLDQKGRLRTSPDTSDLLVCALEIVIRKFWKSQFLPGEKLTKEFYIEFIQKLLLAHENTFNEPEKTTVCLQAIDILTNEIAETFFDKPNKAAVNLLGKIKSKIEITARRQARILQIIPFSIMLIIYGILIALVFKKTWDVMEQWTFIVGIGILVIEHLIFIATLQEINPKAIYEKLLEYRTKQLLKKFDFNLNEYEELMYEQD